MRRGSGSPSPAPAPPALPWLDHGPPLHAFWLRESDAPLLQGSGPLLALGDPPFARGELAIELDHKGRLYSLRADPEAQLPPRPVDWHPLLLAAGFDPSKLTPSAPRTIPPVYADARAAWSGVYPDDPRVPVTIEAAMRGGTPVFFSVSGPWADPSSVRRVAFGSPALVVFLASMVIAALGASCFLAWRNVRANRVDRRGVARLAAFVFAITFVAFLLLAHHALAFSREVTLLRMAGAEAALWAALYSLLYVAIEPYFRRRWPERLISWVRLLGGGVHDPLVGRDVLVGVTAGLLHATIASLTPGTLLYGETESLRGFGAGAALLLECATRAMLDGLVITTLLVLLTMLLRKRTAVAIALFLVQAVGYVLASRALSVLPLLLLLGVILTFVLVRVGLLAFVVTQMVFRCVFFWQTPASADDWYFAQGVMSLVFVIALAFYAARVAAGVTPATRR